MYSGLRCDSIMYDGQVTSQLRINLLYDGEHYHAITNLTGVMARRYECLACNKDCRRGECRACDALCDSCSASPVWVWDHARCLCNIGTHM